MKKRKLIGRYLLAHLIASLFCGLCSSCRSTGYLGDRCRDAGDIITTTIGKGAGAKVRVGPIHAGAFVNRDCAGLRSGTLFSDWKKYGGMFSFVHHPSELDLTVFLAEGTGPMLAGTYHDDAQVRGKTYDAGSRIPLLAIVEDRPLYMHWHYYTQVEAAVGLGGTLRVGFNIGELFDFILGWTTLDILHDDLGRKERLPHSFSLGGQSTSSGWYVFTLEGHHADPNNNSSVLSAIIQSSVNPQGTRFLGAKSNGEMKVRIQCFSNGKFERDQEWNIKEKTLTLAPGFHVYERRGNDLVQADFSVTPEQFMSFVNSEPPEHSLQSLQMFLENQTTEPSNQ